MFNLSKEIIKTITTKYDAEGKIVETKEETIEKHYAQPMPTQLPTWGDKTTVLYKDSSGNIKDLSPLPTIVSY